MSPITRASGCTKTESSDSTCLLCALPVRSVDYAVQCEKCEGWTHCGCANISLTLYKCLINTKTTQLHIECNNCRPVHLVSDVAASTSPASSDSETETLCGDLDDTCIHAPLVSESAVAISLSSHSTEQSKCLRSYAEVAAPSGNQNTETDTKQASLLMSTSGRDTSGKSKKSARRPRMLDIVKRIHNIEEALSKASSLHSGRAVNKPVAKGPDRTRCFLLFNAPESQEMDPGSRMEHDRHLLEDMVSKLFEPNEPGISVSCAFRLGKKPDDPISQPRPLKVVVESENDCLRIFSRIHRLKSEKYRVARDLSPEDRKRMREAVNELKQRRAEGETHLVIQDFRVVRRPPRVGWKPVTLRPLATIMA